MAVAELPEGDENTWLGEFAETWFRILCTAAACPTAKVSPDQVSVDFVVHDHGYEIIRVQVKATEAPILTKEGYAYDLDRKAYDRLRQGTTPGYVALLVLHRPHPRWVHHYPTGAVVRATAYWSRITGMPETTNTTSVRVPLLSRNILTPDVLLTLFPEGGDDSGTTS